MRTPLVHAAHRATAMLYSKERIAALTDGIFAVSMTLLVLDLRVPEAIGGEAALWEKLAELSSRADDYVISFVLLCAFWLSHHRLLHQLRGVDPVFLWLNFAFVLFTTFVPWSTALVGRYPGQHLSALLYGGNIMLVLVSEIVLWRYGTSRIHSEGDVAAAAAWYDSRKRFLLAFAGTVCAIVVSALEVRAGIGIVYSSYVYLAALALIVSRPHRGRRSVPSTEEPLNKSLN